MGEISKAYNWFKMTLEADIDDIQGGTTKEGIHVGLMGGTISLVLRSFIGLEEKNGFMSLDPRLPKAWKKVSFCVPVKGGKCPLEVSHKAVTVRMEGNTGKKSQILVGNRKYTVTSKPKKIKI